MEKDDKKYDLTQEEYNRCLIRAELQHLCKEKLLIDQYLYLL